MPSKHILLYDDSCPLCTFQMKLISWLDWFSKIDRVALSSEETKEWVVNIKREDLQEQIHCLTTKNKTHKGAYALRFIGMRIPLFLPMALVLWLPGVIFVAQKIYMLISKNRHLLSKLFGCKEACKILPEKKHQIDVKKTSH